MRMIFGVLSLLIVLAIIGSLAKQQLQALQVPVDASGAAASTPLRGTPAQQSQQLQRKMVDDIGKAMEKGVHRSDGESAQ